MITSENKIAGEMHGCIVCAKLYNILVVYTPEGKLLDCTVPSPVGHIVPDEQRPLVACDTHTEELIRDGSPQTAKRQTMNKKTNKVTPHGF